MKMKNLVQEIKQLMIYKNPVRNGFYIVSELDGLLKSGYYESPVGYDHVN